MMFLVLDKDTAISTLIFVKGTLTFFFKFQAYNVAGPLYMKFQHYSLKIIQYLISILRLSS